MYYPRVMQWWPWVMGLLALAVSGVSWGASGVPSGVDLQVTVEAALEGVPVGIEREATFIVANVGTAPATGVHLTNSLAGAAAWDGGVVASQGTCSLAGSELVCELGMLAPGARVAVLAIIMPGPISGPATSSTWTITSVAGSRETDVTPADNRVVTLGSSSVGGSVRVGPMADIRAGHEAVSRPDGTVLVSGGGLLPVFERYDPRTEAFSSLAVTSRWIPSLTVPLADGRLLLIENGGTYNERLDPEAGVVEAVANTVDIRSFSAGVLLTNGEVMLVGGDWVDSRTEVFDPGSGQFRRGPIMAYGRRDFSATRLRDGRLLVAGGTRDLEASASGELYDPGTGAFGMAGLLVAPRRYHAASLALDGRVLLSGGWIYTTDPRTLEWYEPGPGGAAGRFVAAGLMRDPRSNHTSTLLPDGRILLAGGEGTNVWIHATTEIFDPATGRTEPGPRMTVGRSRHTATLLPDGRVLLVGGEVREWRLGAWRSDFLKTAEVLEVNGRRDLPEVRVRDGAVVEGQSGWVGMEFRVELSRAGTAPVTLSFGTVDFTANRVDDFQLTNGVVTFPPGVTGQVVRVWVRGDVTPEPDEVFWLDLADVAGAWPGRSRAAGRIGNDDGVPVALAEPASVVEGDGEAGMLTFGLTLSLSNAVPVLVRYHTADLTVPEASAGVDYYPVQGVAIFPPGVVRQSVRVAARGDLVVEAAERLRLVLDEAEGASVGIAEVAGTIMDDDGVPGRLAGFDWDLGPGPWHAGVPFPVTVTGRDAFGQPVSGLGLGLPASILLSSRVGEDPVMDESFDGVGFGVWVPVEAGSKPGPYGVALADVDGDGRESPAIFLWPNSGVSDGYRSRVRLQAGRRYRFRVNCAVNPGGTDSLATYCWMRMLVDGVPIAERRFDIFPPVKGDRGVLSGLFTAPATRDYDLSLLADDDTLESPLVVAWFDDFTVSGLDVDPAGAVVGPEGHWSGWVTLAGAGRDVTLRADDGNGHLGVSPSILVQPAADLVMSRAVHGQGTGLLRVGGWLTNSLTVSNVGLSGATGVVLDGAAAAGMRFVSASAPLGACEVTPEAVRCRWDSLTNRGAAIASVVLRSVQAGAWTNRYAVSGTEHDPDPANNVAEVGAAVQLPLISVLEGSGWEGDGGPTNLLFPVVLSGASAVPVTVRYAAVNDTAVAGRDYEAVAGELTFSPMVTNQVIAVPLLGNVLDEPDRQLRMTLFAPTGAVLFVADAFGIVRDDDPPPVASIADAIVGEGDSGVTNAVFVVSLSKPAIVDVVLPYWTAPGTAASGTDYLTRSGSVRIPAGVTSGVVEVTVVGDWVHEGAEQFEVRIGGAAGVTLGRASGAGIIVDDDAVPGRLDHYEWVSVGTPGPWWAGVSFPVHLRGVDYQGGPVSAVVGPVQLRARTEAGVKVSFRDGFESGVLSGWTNRSPTVVALITNETAATGQRSLRVTGGNPNVSLSTGVASNRATVIRFAIRANQTNLPAGELTAMGGFGYVSAAFRMNADGRMGLRGPNGVFRTVPYEARRWYDIELRLDWTNRLIRCLVDGQPAITNSFPSDPYAGIDTVYLNNPGGGTVWWDDLELREEGLSLDLPVSPAILDGLEDGVWTGRLTVAGAGMAVVLRAEDALGRSGVSLPFEVRATPDLRLVLPAQVGEGAAPVEGSVELPVALAEPLTVALAVSEPAELIVPAFVQVPAGETRVTFPVVSPDDEDWNAVRRVTLTATSGVFPETKVQVDVLDDELAQISLSVVGGLVEGRTVGAGGLVTVSVAPTMDVRIELESGDTNVVQVPAVVVVPAGRTSVAFDLVLPDNGRMEAAGTSVVRARAGRWMEGETVVRVEDDEPRRLTLAGGTGLREGVGTVAQGIWIELGGTLPTNVVVTLSSSDPDELQVPGIWVVPAGQKGVWLSVFLPDDAERDGSQPVTVVASAPGLEGVMQVVFVADNDLHHLTFDVLPSRATSGVPFLVRVQARDVRGAAIAPTLESLSVEGFDGLGNRVRVAPTNGLLASGGVWQANLTVWSLPTLMGLRVRTIGGVEAESAPFAVDMPKSRILGSLTAEHLVWDRFSARLYAAVTNVGVVVIEPVSGEVERVVPVSGRPTRLAVSRGGEYLYVGGMGTNRVRRFSLPGLALDLDFSIGVTLSWGPAYTEDLAVHPDLPRSVAVSRRRLNVSPRHESVTLYDDGVPRPLAEQEHTGSNLIEFGADGSVIYGIDSETSPSSLLTLAVGPEGLTVSRETFNPVMPFSTRETTWDAGRLYADSGEVIDPATGFRVSSLGGGNVVPDSGANRVASVGTLGTRLAGLTFWNQRTLTIVGSLSVTNITGVPAGMARWGDQGLAFRTSGGQIVLVYTPLLATEPPPLPRISSLFRRTDRVEVRFDTVPDRYYRLEVATEPVGFLWQPVSGGVLLGTGGPISLYHFERPDAPQRYYRIRAEH